MPVSKSKRKRSTPEVYVACVVWEFDPKDRTLEEYEFPTEAERDAFIFGVSEADPGTEYHFCCTDPEEAQAYLDSMNEGDAEDM